MNALVRCVSVLGIALSMTALARDYGNFPPPSTSPMPSTLRLRVGERRSFYGYTACQPDPGAAKSGVVEITAVGPEMHIRALKSGSAHYTLYRGSPGRGGHRNLDKQKVTIEVESH